MPNDNDDRILWLLSMSAKGVIDHVKQNLYEKRDEGDEITRYEIEVMLESGVEQNLLNEEWHLMEALKAKVKDDVSVEDLYQEFNNPEGE